MHNEPTPSPLEENVAALHQEIARLTEERQRLLATTRELNVHNQALNAANRELNAHNRALNAANRQLNGNKEQLNAANHELAQIHARQTQTNVNQTYYFTSMQRMAESAQTNLHQLTQQIHATQHYMQTLQPAVYYYPLAQLPVYHFYQQPQPQPNPPLPVAHQGNYHLGMFRGDQGQGRRGEGSAREPYYQHLRRR